MNAKTPIEVLLDQIEWKACDGPVEELRDGVPFATHVGVLEIGGHKLRCYQLNDGRRIFVADDFHNFLSQGADASETNG